MKVIGKCSLCGGFVSIPDIWGGLISPRPTCAQCGAEEALPTIRMTKKERPTIAPKQVDALMTGRFVPKGKHDKD